MLIALMKLKINFENVSPSQECVSSQDVDNIIPNKS